MKIVKTQVNVPMRTVSAGWTIAAGPDQGLIKTRYDTSKSLKYKFDRAKWYVAEYRWEDNNEVLEWCTQQFGPAPRKPDAWTRWTAQNHLPPVQIRFRDQKDYNWFVLRWGA